MSAMERHRDEVFRRRFPREKPLIGMIALPPLPGYPAHPGMDGLIAAALADLAALEAAGFDAVLIENDHDQPHTIGVGPELVEAFAHVVAAVIARARVAVGLELLYDMGATVALAHRLGAAFVRLDVFADAVETRWGTVPACAAAISEQRRAFGADEFLLLTDVHVKHARLLRERSLADSVRDALAHGSDGVIVTGSWTGKPPTLGDLRAAREAAGDAPVIVGSGLTAENAPGLLAVADAAIVGTALQTAGRIDPGKAAALVAAVAPLRAGA
jgi:membrane complex biogenesis BtpA family protein